MMYEIIWFCIFFLIFSDLYGASWFFLTLISLNFTLLLEEAEMSYSYFFFSEYFFLLYLIFHNTYNYTLATIMLMGKLGIPPLHSWLYEIFLQSNWQITMLLLSWMKFIPLLLITNEMTHNFKWPLLMCFCLAQTMIFFLTGNSALLFFSGQATLMLMMMTAMINFMWFTKFFSFYLIITTLTWAAFSLPFTTLPAWIILNLSGLPFSPLFFMKTFILISMSYTLTTYTLIMLVFSLPVIMMFVNTTMKSLKEDTSSNLLLLFFFLFFLFMMI